MEMDNVNVEQVEETIALFSSMDMKTAVRGLLFLVVGLVLVRLALILLSHMLKKSRTIPASAHTMIKTLMRILLDVVVVLAAANTVGIPITSFMVFLSVIGIAISLAVQGILSNFAGGILLLVSRPFAIGDFIECGSVSGTVLDITMLHIKLQAPDRKVVYLPNSTVYSSILTNASISPIRRVDVSVSASYDNSPAQVREAVLDLTRTIPGILQDPEVQVHVENYGDSAIGYTIWAFCEGKDFLTVKYALLEGLYDAFRAHSVEMTYPHMNVHMQDG